tara:strand:+ start:137 stop:601 length:465 start_codon:yes stop_codon:yes gene_type:complete
MVLGLPLRLAKPLEELPNGKLPAPEFLNKIFQIESYHWSNISKNGYESRKEEVMGLVFKINVYASLKGREVYLGREENYEGHPRLTFPGGLGELIIKLRKEGVSDERIKQNLLEADGAFFSSVPTDFDWSLFEVQHRLYDILLDSLSLLQQEKQ